MERGFQAQSIDEVISAMTGILNEAIINGERIGYFAGLYLRVTESVKRAILAGDVFQDNARMERLDVTFANRFFAAWDAWRSGQQPTAPWAVAFEALSSDRYMVVQHLGAAMNAHIDLDLGVAAEEVMRQRGEPLAQLQADFNMINTVLERLIGIVQVQLTEVSDDFSELERLFPRLQAQLFGRALDGIRGLAWSFAEHLDAQDSDEARQRAIDARAAVTAEAGRVVLAPDDIQDPIDKKIEQVFGDGLLGRVIEGAVDAVTADTIGRSVDDFIAAVAAQEAAHGVRYCAQIVAE